ncbi:hypothetical protein FCU45_05960 [Sulfurimonas crateris]|uniref:Alginate export domain-containing protein n=1 Tax=Sulfurimonas crateris TaxID=2574727 RepID=A0A4U2Z7Y1_9BACT|nr:alginate export family protein [Sulfurimonas crateris]TKI69600.1 hypothetical protein FCU45_05960 [Sulfurimonas crateris]
MNKRTAKLSLLSLIASSLYAEFDYDAEVRLRFESFDNMNEKYYGTKPMIGESRDSYLMTRVRFGVGYKFNDNWSAKLSMQDSRVIDWGFKSDDFYNREFGEVNSSQTDSFELGKTFLEYKNKKMTVTVGRQSISYGDSRVFGPGEWKNSGKWIWDAVKVSLKEGDNFLDFFYGATMLHDPDDFSLNHRHGYYGGGVYGHYAYKKSAAIEPIFAYKTNERKNELYNSLENFYAGARVYDRDINRFFYDMTYIKSFGDYTKVTDEKVYIDAVGYHLEGGYNFKSLNTKVGLGHSYASGDDPNTKERETFDAVFGASDKYYGRLNLVQWNNLKDYELFAILTPDSKTSIKIEYHKLYAHQQSNKWMSYTIASMQNDHYGDEIDIFTTYRYSKSINFLVGAGYFMSGGYIREAATKNGYITDDNAVGFVAQVAYNF